MTEPEPTDPGTKAEAKLDDEFLPVVGTVETSQPLALMLRAAPQGMRYMATALGMRAEALENENRDLRAELEKERRDRATDREALVRVTAERDAAKRNDAVRVAVTAAGSLCLGLGLTVAETEPVLGGAVVLVAVLANLCGAWFIR